MKTIAHLPLESNQRINITINDREFDVVARNAILLLLSLTAKGDTNASEGSMFSTDAEALIHMWYSASIPLRVLSSLQTRVKPLIMEVCQKICHKSPETISGKTWEFPAGQSFRLVLKTKYWLQLVEFLDTSDDLTSERASKFRMAVTLAPDRADYRDRWYFKDASPFMRVAKQRFREDGLLLPFGHPRTVFCVPNP